MNTKKLARKIKKIISNRDFNDIVFAYNDLGRLGLSEVDRHASVSIILLNFICGTPKKDTISDRIPSYVDVALPKKSESRNVVISRAVEIQSEMVKQ